MGAGEKGGGVLVEGGAGEEGGLGLLQPHHTSSVGIPNVVWRKRNSCLGLSATIETCFGHCDVHTFVVCHRPERTEEALQRTALQREVHSFSHRTEVTFACGVGSRVFASAVHCGAEMNAAGGVRSGWPVRRRQIVVPRSCAVCLSAVGTPMRCSWNEDETKDLWRVVRPCCSHAPLLALPLAFALVLGLVLCCCDLSCCEFRGAATSENVSRQGSCLFLTRAINFISVLVGAR